MQIIHHINQLQNLSDREFNNATALPPNNLLRRVDDCVMNTLFSGALSFESTGSPPQLFLRLSLRVLRNIVYSGYSPVRLATFAIFHPLRTLQALPFYLMRLSLAIFSLDSLIAMAGSSMGGAMAIAITLGGAAPPVLLPAFVAGVVVALIKGIKNNKPTSFLELLESFLTGLVFGLGSAWFMRRRMESRLEKAKQQLSETVRLPSGATGFVNNQNQAIFQCSGSASVREFLEKNPELAASFREHFHHSHQSQTSLYHDRAYYGPSHVLVAENGNVFVRGRYLIDSNHNSTTHLIWTIKNTANALPSQEIQEAVVTSLGIGVAAVSASGRQLSVQSQQAARAPSTGAAAPAIHRTPPTNMFFNTSGELIQEFHNERLTTFFTENPHVSSQIRSVFQDRFSPGSHPDWFYANYTPDRAFLNSQGHLRVEGQFRCGPAGTPGRGLRWTITTPRNTEINIAPRS